MIGKKMIGSIEDDPRGESPKSDWQAEARAGAG
jgi:hypothetical protein